MNIIEILTNGFNAASLPNIELDMWLLHFDSVSSLSDIRNCIKGLDIADDGSFLDYLANGDLEDACISINAPTDGTAVQVLERLQAHPRIQSIVGSGDSFNTFHLLHQKPGNICKSLQDALQGEHRIIVGENTFFGPMP